MKYLAFVVFLVTSFFCKGQALNHAEAGIAVGKREGTLTLGYFHTWQPGKKKRFEIGLAGRFTSYFGSTQYHITAPAKLTSGETGPLVIFKENIVANIDTFLIKSPQVNALNIAIHLGYRIHSKVVVGFNIDAIGFSFGRKVTGNYINGFQGQRESSSPTAFNLLLISDNDLGTLNSELYARYSITDSWGIKGGLQFLFTEYTTDTQVQHYPEPNDRFRDKSLLLTAGVFIRL